jgi:DNA-binding Lrp family transcriptional regulator
VNRVIKDEEKEPEQLILRLLSDEGELTDKEIAERLKVYGFRPYACLNLCFQLVSKGLIKRVSVQGKPHVNRIIEGENSKI